MDAEIQLTLPDPLYQWLSRETQRRGVSTAQLVTLALQQYAQGENEAFDMTETRTWELCGTFDIVGPSPEYVVGHDDQGEVITNYAEHVDDILYGGD